MESLHTTEQKQSCIVQTLQDSSPALQEQASVGIPALQEQESPKLDSSESSSQLEEQRRIKEELESLCMPCNMEFTISIRHHREAVTAKKQKKKLKGGAAKTVEVKEMVCLEMSWIHGDTDRDILHQLLQYLQNKIDTLEP